MPGKPRNQLLPDNPGRVAGPPFGTGSEQSAHIRVELSVADFPRKVAFEHCSGDRMALAVHVLAERAYDALRIASPVRQSHGQIEQVPPLATLVERSHFRCQQFVQFKGGNIDRAGIPPRIDRERPLPETQNRRHARGY